MPLPVADAPQYQSDYFMAFCCPFLVISALSTRQFSPWNANGNAKYSIPQIEDSLETDFVVPTKSWPNGTLLQNCSIESGAYDYLISLTLRGTCLGHEIADEV